MKIETTVRVEITDVRGERFVMELEAIANRGDNPRFIAASTENELGALSTTVVNHLLHHYGGEEQLAESRAERGGER